MDDNLCYTFFIELNEVNMKKVVILVLVLMALVFPLAAKTNLINFGYNVTGRFFGYEDRALRSVGVDFINLKGDSVGLYTQFNPYYALSQKINGVVYKHSDYDITSAGLNLILGYGGDLNFGSMGLIIGGGAYGDFNFFTDSVVDTFTLTGGLGLGANFYYQPGDGTFVINAGLTFSWTPWSYQTNEYASVTYTDYKMTNTNFNIGIGWRTGGIGSKSSSTSSSGSSGGGSADDW